MRKGVKWLRKLGIELFICMSIALVLFQTSRRKKFKIRNLRESLCEGLLQAGALIIITITSAQRLNLLLSQLLRRKTMMVRDKKEHVKAATQELKRSGEKKLELVSAYCPAWVNELVLCFECVAEYHK